MIHFFLTKDKRVIISNHERSKIKKKFGNDIELLLSIVDKDSIEIIKARMLRNQSVTFVEYLHVDKVVSKETREKMSMSHKGLKHDETTKQKISRKRKGKSNFEGKKHTNETKQLIGIKQKGNKNVANKHWVYNPRSFKEKRIESSLPPEGYMRGRDVDSIEPMMYESRTRRNTI